VENIVIAIKQAAFSINNFSASTNGTINLYVGWFLIFSGNGASAPPCPHGSQRCITLPQIVCKLTGYSFS
jgi:hypothetical protein